MYTPSPLRTRFLQLALPAVALLLLLSSCSRVVTDTPETDRIAVDFSLRIGTTSTRAVGTQWGPGDALGVFMLRKGSALHSSNILDDADNLRYITSSSGELVNLIPASEEQIMYYPVDGSSVDFLAYYPYGNLTSELSQGEGAGNYIYPVRVNDQTNLSAIDLLYSRGSGSKSDKTVRLQFAHQLSKIRIILCKSAGLSILDLTGSRIDLNGMPLASGFSLVDQSFDYRNPLGEEEIGTIQTQVITDGAVYEALVLPQPADRFKGRSVGIALPVSSPSAPPYAYAWSIPDGTAFRSGKEYTYTFTLHGSGVEFGGVEITDWEDYSFESTVVEMVDISGGTFLMGSSHGNPDETPHEVTLTDFMISRFPITNAQYAAYLNAVQLAADGILGGNRLLAVPHPVLTCTTSQENLGAAPRCRWHVSPGKDDYPVSAISWYGAQSFATWHGGSLPSEAQWEYACRQKLMNSNSHDIHGNIWEWCLDWYGGYTIPAGIDPIGVNPTSGKRVLRGGACDSPVEDHGSTIRHKDTPDCEDIRYGFRIAIAR